MPEHLAGYFIQRCHGTLCPAGRADHLLPVDEDALRITPTRAFSAELRHGGPPEFLAVLRLHGDEGAIAAERINFVAIDGGGAARAVAPLVIEDAAEFR